MGSKGAGKTPGKSYITKGKKGDDPKGKADPIKGTADQKGQFPGNGKTATGKGIGQGQLYQRDDTTPGK